MPCIPSSRATHKIVKSCCPTGCGCGGNSFYGNPYCPCNFDNPAPIQNTCLEDSLCAFLSGPTGLTGTYASSIDFYNTNGLNSVISRFTTTCGLCPGQTVNILATGISGTTGSLVVGTVTPGMPSTVIDGGRLTNPGTYNLSVIGGSSLTPCLTVIIGST